MAGEIDSDLKGAQFAEIVICYMALDESGPCQSDAEHALTLKTPYLRARSRKAWVLRKPDEKNDGPTELNKSVDNDFILTKSLHENRK
jgi:hypothetical protein